MDFYSAPGQQALPNGLPPSAPKKQTGFASFLWIILAIIIGSILFNVVTSSPGTSSSGEDEVTAAASTETTSADPPTADPAEQRPTYVIGQPVQSKKFEYIVTDFSCGIRSVGEHEITREDAKGQFCQLSITAMNIATKAASLSFSDFKLMSGEIEYSTESWVNIIASSGTDSGGFLDKINPGLQVNGNIYFDVPLDVIPDRALVKDMLLGKPATINLR